MCFDLDSRPPITPIAGGALDSARLTLTADDGATFAAFRARAANPSGAGMIVLPDVRGLHPYYEELTLRFAEHGVDAVAVDYFGRTAGAEPRDDDFEYMPHVGQTTWAGLSADIRAAAADLRSPDGGSVRSLYAIGFCMGGRIAYLTSTLGLDVAGVIGFYGWPTGPARNDTPAPADVAPAMQGSILGIFGGADQGITPSVIAEFESALTAADVEHRLISYPGAPHGFFDRKASEFAEASDAAWAETLSFIGGLTKPTAG
jgi:carboxymethylenebutenolidase